MNLNEVFVPGGFPRVTYVPRDELQLEEQVRDYLEARHTVLSLSGPTKSGKTVLIKQVAPDAIWVSGGDISSAADFWRVLVDRLDGWIEVAKQRGKSEGEATTGSVEGEISAVVARGRAGFESQMSSLDERVHTVRRDRSAQQVAVDLLQLTKPTVVVDDFHYLGERDQLTIVRGLRSTIFEGVPVILLSVPHRAYDAVRAEPEMTGRVVPLVIPFWSGLELAAIASKGFNALNVKGRAEDVKRLVSESFGSPFLMQSFCLEFCRQNGIRRTADEPHQLEHPDWEAFFRARADATAKTAFERLATGPRARTKRIPRVLEGGETVDIYGLVLAAIAHTGPKTRISDDELRVAIREIMVGDPPASHEVTRVLEAMTDIARRGKGEPVVDYMPDERQLHIADPFFAYYLRWGAYRGGV